MKDGTKYNKGDIILIPFPFTDLTGMKKRPAIIISGNKLNSTKDRICCLITSNPEAEGITIKQENYTEQPLPYKSKVKPQRIFTISTNIILKQLSTVNKEFQERIKQELNTYL